MRLSPVTKCLNVERRGEERGVTELVWQLVSGNNCVYTEIKDWLSHLRSDRNNIKHDRLRRVKKTLLKRIHSVDFAGIWIYFANTIEAVFFMLLERSQSKLNDNNLLPLLCHY